MTLFGKTNLRPEERKLILNGLTILLGLFVWFTVTYYTVYQKAEKFDLLAFLGSYNIETEPDLYLDKEFIESYAAIHDPEFFSHNGITFIEDLGFTLKKLISPDSVKVNKTLTRRVSEKIDLQGKMAGFYKQYVFPVLIESELDKNTILKISMVIRQEEAGITYEKIMEHLGMHNHHGYNKYHWILLHAVFESFYNGETNQYNIEILFFDALTSLYESGFIREPDLKNIYAHYRAGFLSDTAMFFFNYNNNLQLFDSFLYHKNKLGGAINFAGMVNYYAEKYEISFPLFLAIVQSESNGDPGAVSNVGAMGLAQIMPATARDVTQNVNFRDENLFDPKTNLDIAAKYIKKIQGWVDARYPNLDKKNRIDFVASAYNAGWTRVKETNGIPNILETRNYVQRVHHYHDLYSQQVRNAVSTLSNL